MEMNLADLFEGVADALPEREALVAGATRLTYAGLEGRANRLARALADRGVGQGEAVGLMLYNGVPFVEAMLACFKLRAVPVNINYRYLAAELQYLLGDSGCRIVLHERGFEDRLSSAGGRLLIPVDDAYERMVAEAVPDRDFPRRSADDVYLLYTGGTTGMPKGVVWRHEDIIHAAMAGAGRTGDQLESAKDVVRAAVASPGRRALPASPLMHGTAQWTTFTLFQEGGAVVLCLDRSLNPRALWSLVATERIGLLVIIGDAFGRPLLDALEATGASWDLSALRIIMSGGAILSPYVRKGFARLLPDVRLLDVYGSSEAGTQGRMSVGADATAPVFKVGEHTAVLDDGNKPVVPGSGQVGQIARRGHVPIGYHNDPAKTAATFPVIDGTRWSVPGDMATVDLDGTIRLLGRGSACINTGGEKVYAEEVEAVLKGHPAVFDAVVVGVPDERWGELVTAVVEPRGPAQPEPDDLRQHVQGQLAAYKAPRRIVFVDQVVRAPSGKADYKWARELVAGAGR
jgi:3-oxocholest-4-en-26-oate---CoA ligase